MTVTIAMLQQLLDNLRCRGLDLVLDLRPGENDWGLRVVGPNADLLLTAQLREEIRTYKPELVQFLMPKRKWRIWLDDDVVGEGFGDPRPNFQRVAAEAAHDDRPHMIAVEYEQC